MLAAAVGAAKHGDHAGARLREAFELGVPLDPCAALVERLAQQSLGLALRLDDPTERTRAARLGFPNSKKLT